MAKKSLDPIHPGEILLEEFLKPFGLSQNQLARDLDVPATRINEVVNGARPITIDTAMRLARYFGTTPEFWLNLQQRYDLLAAQSTLGPLLEKKITPREELMS
ncbi:MAG: HigA family addiction module antitoxin [Pirellulales bacterium]|nr:HigA family addiction module antidote protein [Planctomycetales bacterium]